jgi:dihydroorotate dehydrogenase electron transfer subunit
MSCSNTINDYKALIKECTLVAENVYSMLLQTDNIHFRAGQFLMIDSPSFPLRRPFAIVESSDGLIRIIFKVIGKGTKELASLKPGHEIKILAPLGSFFPLPDNDRVNSILVGGGTGIISLLSLVKMLKGKTSVILGFANANAVMLEDEFSTHSEVFVSTEDGTYGTKGNVIDILKDMGITNPKNTVIYSCGPHGMLKAVNEFAAQHSVKHYTSLEERMACGVGACFCCSTKTVSGIKRACKEGPVFDSEELLWEEL